MFFYGFTRHWRTNKTSMDISATLKSVSETVRFGMVSYEAEFLGTVSQDTFRLFPCRKHIRNSFCPLAHGKVQPTETGCTVDVRFRMWIPMMVFSALWCAPLILLGLFGVLLLLSGDVSEGAVLTLAPMAFLGVAFLLEYFAFYLPAKRMEVRLRTLLEAEEDAMEKK